MSSSSSQRWLLPSAEVVTVGLPFCAFKLLTGLILVGTALAPLGVALVALGAIDLALNALNLATLLTARRRVSGVCLADVLLGRGAVERELALALDMFLSFTLVAAVVGFGLLLRLPGWALTIWNLAVVLNVLGAGIGRLVAAFGAAR